MISRIFVGQQGTSMFFKNPSKNCKNLILQDIFQNQLAFVFKFQAGQVLALTIRVRVSVRVRVRVRVRAGVGVRVRVKC